MKSKLLFTIFLLSLFLNLYNLQDFTFIGDQGWFYLAAKDMIVQKEIPLVGITSSYTWIHQGPFWTYIIGLIFLIFDFNPLNPAIFTGVVGSLSIFLLYFVTKKLFSEKIALFSSLLYAISPIVILNFRMPYHTTLIPIFSILFLYALFNWINGSRYHFVFFILLLSILYNFELATQSLWGLVFLILGYGIFKKKKWVKKIFTLKIIILSIFAFIIPLVPVIVYDFNHGFFQTVKFYRWMLLSIVRQEGGIDVFGYIRVASFLMEKVRFFIFSMNKYVAIIILIVGISLSFLNRRNINKGEKLLYLSILFILLGVIITKTPSDAYIPPLFPYLAIFFGIFLERLYKINKIFSYLLIGIIVSFNTYDIIKTNYYTLFQKVRNIPYQERVEVTKRITKIADGKKYLLKTLKPVRHESYLMNYNYILWWMGNEPSDEADDIFYINETEDSIELKHESKK